MTQQVTLNGTTYSDDGSVGKGLDNGGFRENLFPMFGDLVVESASKVAAAEAKAAAAANQAAIAKAQADIAITAAASTVTGPGTTGSSTTNMTVGLGTKNFVIQPGKTWYRGMPLSIAASTSPRDAMYGTLDSYDPVTGAMVARVTNIATAVAGVFLNAADWTISLVGMPGVTGVLNEFKGTPIASAAVIDLSAADGNYLHLTGSAGPVTSVVVPQGASRTVTLDGTPVFAHSATLILPTGANVTGEAGDVITFRGEGAGVTKVTSWTRASGLALAVVPVVKPGRVLLASIVPTGGPFIELINVFTSEFDSYEIEAVGIGPVSRDYLYYRFFNSSLDVAQNYVTTAPGGSSGSFNTYGQIGDFHGGAGYTGNFELRIKNVNDAVGLKSAWSECISEALTNNFFGVNWWCAYRGPAITGIRLFWQNASNYMAGGRLQLFGIRKT